MTEPHVVLDPDRAKAEPGGQVSVEVRITNLGNIVEGYQVSVLGDAREWAEVLPPEVSVYPGKDATVKIVFSPPAGRKAPSGDLSFGVMVQSTLEEDDRVVVEGTLEIGRLFGLQGVLRPVASRGRWHGRHVITIANWGNTRAQLRLTAVDPDNALGFLIKPELVTVPIGGVTSAQIKVRTRSPMLRGTPVRLPFQIIGEPIGEDRPDGPTPAIPHPDRPLVDGALLQKPILTRTAVTAAVVAAVVLITGLAWLAVNRAPGSAAELQPSGPPDVPVLQAVGDLADPRRPIILRWNSVPHVSGYTIREAEISDGQIVPVQGEVQIEPRDITIVAPASVQGRHCYQIRALRTGSPASAWSEPACAEGGPASPSSSPTPTTSPKPTDAASPQSTESPQTATPGESLTPDAWVAAIVVGPEGMTDDNAAKLRAALNKDQRRGRFIVVLSSSYTGLRTQAPGAVSNMVISGAMPDATSAAQLCTEITPLLNRKNGALAGTVCRPVQVGQPT